jgi:hypothetical protein
MLVITSFARVPIPEVGALWERLQTAGWAAPVERREQRLVLGETLFPRLVRRSE